MPGNDRSTRKSARSSSHEPPGQTRDQGPLIVFPSTILFARTAHTLSECFERSRFQSRLPQGHETLELPANLLLQSVRLLCVFPTVELPLQGEAHVTNTEGRSMRRMKRASRGPAKRASHVILMRGCQLRRRRARQPERRRLVVREEVLRMARAAVPAGIRYGRRPHAIFAGFHPAKPRAQCFSQRPQPHRRFSLFRACRLSAVLSGEPLAHHPQLLGTRARNEESVDNVLNEYEHGVECTRELNRMHGVRI